MSQNLLSFLIASNVIKNAELYLPAYHCHFKYYFYGGLSGYPLQVLVQSQCPANRFRGLLLSPRLRKPPSAFALRAFHSYPGRKSPF